MKTMLMVLVAMMTSYKAPNEKAPKDAVEAAKEFVTLVDENNASSLEQVLHPEMMQFAKIGDKLMPFKRRDFIQMVADKKLGGTPREISVKDAQVIRGETVDVKLQAVSHEYDFMYQISLAKEAGKWLVVTVLSDIKPIKE
ncbi:MAG: nuclear transport factor 2 family protein [Bacteroidota bacterium]